MPRLRASFAHVTGATRAALASTLILILGLSGCDDEPSCAVLTSMTGGYEGTLDWRPQGRDSCGIGDPTIIDPSGSLFAFIDRSGQLPQYLYVVPATPIPTEDTYPATVAFIVGGGNYWISDIGDCTVEIVQFEAEDWSVIDFLQIRGAVTCPNPLVSDTAGVESITMSPMGFDAHVHDERLSFEFL